MASPASPFAPEGFPLLPAVAGVRLAARACGLRTAGRDDVMVASLADGTAVAGTLTRSSTASEPVEWCRVLLPRGRARALVVNSGNANAFTGGHGAEAVRRTANTAAQVLGCAAEDVFAASTGVIGEPLPVDKLLRAFVGLDEAFAAGTWERAARAIMTTDTYPKGAGTMAAVDGHPVAVSGIAKGSGMIAPNMATMLAFVFTDAAVTPAALQTMLSPSVDRSFNSITVDSDTSTSDTVLLFATGSAGHPPITDADDPRAAGLRAAIETVCVDLAHQIVRDGEGASRFVTITVTGAADDGAARRIGLAIANSPLVKTAIAGGDANWGRIVMAVGKSGEQAKRERLAIRIGGYPVAETGAAVSGYDETPVAAHMRGREILIEVDVAVGDGRATVWTCDLTHGYININADYRS